MIDVQRPEQSAPGKPVPARGRRRGSRGLRSAGGAVAALVVVGGSLMTGPGTALAASSGEGGSSGGASGAAGRPGGFAVSGTLVSVGSTSLKFKLTDGTVATATLSSSTTYTKTANVKVSALSNGKTVTVTGTTTNGVLAASRIMVTATGALGGFGGAGGGRPAGAGGSETPRSFPEGGGGAAWGREGFGEGFGAGGANFPTFGTVSGLSGGSFTLTEFNKTKVKVTTSHSTTVSETVKTTKSGLTVGQTLEIRGKEVNNTTVAATSVSQGNVGFGGFGGRPGGGTGAPPAA